MAPGAKEIGKVVIMKEEDNEINLLRPNFHDRIPQRLLQERCL